MGRNRRAARNLRAALFPLAVAVALPSCTTRGDRAAAIEEARREMAALEEELQRELRDFKCRLDSAYADDEEMAVAIEREWNDLGSHFTEPLTSHPELAVDAVTANRAAVGATFSGLAAAATNIGRDASYAALQPAAVEARIAVVFGKMVAVATRHGERHR